MIEVKFSLALWKHDPDADSHSYELHHGHEPPDHLPDVLCLVKNNDDDPSETDETLFC
jgi:hypothetical protein